MNKKIILVIFSMLIIPVFASAQDDGQQSGGDAVNIAVFNVAAKTGVAQDTADIITETVIAGIRKMPDVKVISQSEINAMLDLEKQKQLVGCSDDSCMVEIAGAFGVDKIVIGSVGKLGKLYALTLKLVNIRTASSEKQSYQRFKAGDGEELFTASDNAVTELFGKKASKVIEEKEIPKAEAEELPAPQETKLEEDKTDGDTPILPWTLIGVGAAGVITGTVFFVMAKSKYDEYNNYKGDSQMALKTLQDDTKTNATIAYVGWGVGVAAAAVGVVLMLLPDDGDETSDDGISTAIAPAFGAGNAGVQLTLDF